MPFSAGLGYHTRLAHKALSHQLAVALTAEGVPFKHYYYLRALYDEDRITQVELAERTGMERATVTRVLDTMEAGGFVRRVPDPNDRRKILIYLTPYAKRLQKSLRRTIDRLNREALRGVSPADEAAFFRVLRRIAENAASNSTAEPLT